MKSSLAELFNNRTRVYNLLILLLIWFITVLAYVLNTGYSNYFPGDQYDNIFVHSLVEMVAYISSGYIYQKIKLKKLFYLMYTIAILGAISLMSFESDYSDMVSSFVCKYAITSAYQGAFLSNNMFPVIFSSTTFGILITSSGLSTILAKYLSTYEQEYVIPIYTGLCLIAIVIAKLIKENHKNIEDL